MIARGGFAVVLATVALAACGGGTDEPECPTEDCSVPGSTVVKWRFHEYPQWGFLADTCLDLGVTMVRVEAINVADPAAYFMLDKGCGEGQATFLRLPEGTYDIAVTPLDETGAPAVSAPARGQVVAGLPGAPIETTINVPHDVWTRAYTGTFLFKLSWNGMACEPAAVATQTLKLMIDGAVVNERLDNNQKLDGTDDKPCRSFTEPFAQFVADLPFGPATIAVTGKDIDGLTKFDHEFETFIGVGQNNPTITFDLPLPPAM
ncbi:MAG: hypothetical protein H0T89_22270 [Deltaproteobacteria bacterium]|nr:hypothetical protein [Deltaproteobacteria bacterium]MDQ3301443.1 hypothetical protein [Myxococcota bacterium]